MTNQDVFNQIWNYFIVEEHPQSKDSEECICVFYNKITGNKCAIGCLFPDDIAQELEEYYSGCPIVTILLRDSDIAFYLKDVNLELLSELQMAHDYNFPGIKNQLKGIAIKYNLNLPE